MDPIETRRRDARAIWRAGVEAVRPQRALRGHLAVRRGVLHACDHAIPLAEIDRVIVVGCGKAGAEMAVAAEHALGPELLDGGRVEGLVAVPAGAGPAPRAVALHVAREAHDNLPTEAGVQGARRILELVRSAGPRDVVLALISGGGSALLPLPAPGLTLADKIAATTALARAGADITELNVVRKHLSAIKGGQLAEGFGGRLLATFVISDVIGDPLDAIASGPTVPDASTHADALAVVARCCGRDAFPPAALAHLEKGAAGAVSETPDRLGDAVVTRIVAGADQALAAMAEEARRRGYEVVDLGARIAGDTALVAEELARTLREVPASGPLALISGGETTVTLPSGHGLGGRNQEMTLRVALRLEGPDLADAAILCAGSDGEDGPTDAAGALLDADLLQGARARGLDPEAALARHDTHPFHDAAGTLIRSGWTGTNVMDLRVMLRGEPRSSGAPDRSP